MDERCPICGCRADYFVYENPFSDKIVGCDECSEDGDGE